jgi:membrane protein DedA with SNARE-associated domain
VLKVGKYLLLDVHDLERTERFFHGKKSAWTLFACRFIPVVRHLVSIPAGIGKMPFLPFALASTIGATLWNGFLLYCGLSLRENWSLVQKYRHHFDGLIIGMLVVTVVWYVWYKMKRRKAERA